MRAVGQFEIRPGGPADIPEVRRMLEEYVAWIGLDLAFQEINAELDGLPGEYAPPRGALFVAEEGGHFLGTIGLRPLEERACLAGAYDAKAGEMKRLFVRPEARGRGLAKQLIAVALAEARRLQYAEITPIAGTRFMAKRL